MIQDTCKKSITCPTGGDLALECKFDMPSIFNMGNWGDLSVEEKEATHQDMLELHETVAKCLCCTEDVSVEDMIPEFDANYLTDIQEAIEQRVEEKCEEAEVDCAGFEPVSCQLQKPESPNLGSWFELSIAERQTKKEDFTLKMTEYAKTMAMCMCCSPKTSTPTSIETGPEEEIEEEVEDAVEEVELDIRAKLLGEEKAIPVEMT